ncbi:MAG TPA: SdrD B-like domain-containing protein [Tepidisphaeraceae bacterium]|nr:SdrD B-like domain-containing protein [Tepidisphaeraceae bacterium]
MTPGPVTPTPAPGFGDDADVGPGPSVAVSSLVESTFVVTNPGDAPLAGVTVVDDNETPGNSADDFTPTPVLDNDNVHNVGDDNLNGLLDKGEVWLYTATKVVTAGAHTNTATVTGQPLGPTGAPVLAPVFDSDAANWNGGGGTGGRGGGTGSLTGFVYLDKDDDGTIDFGEPGIAGVQVVLKNSAGQVVRTAVTDSDGEYRFQDVPVGTYSVHEVQPAGYADGKETVGTLGGYAVVVGNDVFSTVRIEANDYLINWNFGERPGTTATGVRTGQTATIGFWQNKNGQALIRSLNGGPTAKHLGNWLATNLPNLFGAAATTNLAGKTNDQVAAFFITKFKVKGMKLDAQVLAVALAAYVTSPALAGSAAAAYGFDVGGGGLAAATYNIGTSGAAFGVANYSTLTVWQILSATNALSTGGDGSIYNSNALLQALANTVYDGINNQGDIV